MSWTYELHARGQVPQLYDWISAKFQSFDPIVRASAKVGVADAKDDKARAIVIYNPSLAGTRVPPPPRGSTFVRNETGVSEGEINSAAQRIVDTLNAFGGSSPTGFYAKFCYTDGKYLTARLILCWQGLTDEEKPDGCPD